MYWSWQGCGRNVRARPMCLAQLEGRRRREDGLGVQRRDFLMKKRSKTHLAFWQWQSRLAPWQPCIMARAVTAKSALDLCALSNWKVGEGGRVSEAQGLQIFDEKDSRGKLTFFPRMDGSRQFQPQYCCPRAGQQDVSECVSQASVGLTGSAEILAGAEAN